MKTQSLLSVACLLALVAGGCAGSSEETGAAAQTTPAAAAGQPATVEPPAAQPTPAPMPAPAATPAPATPAASTAQPQAPVPTIGVIVTHKVKDYDAWKKVFDTDADARKAGGFLGHELMRDATNDKIVSVWLPGTDLAKAKAFATNPALKDKMKEGGVVGKPEVAFVNLVLLKSDPAKTGLSAALITATTKDFAAFKTAWEGGAAGLAAQGVVGYGLAQDADKPEIAHLYLQAEDLAKLKAYVDSKDTKKAWKEAGVKGAAKTTFVKEGEMVTYPQ